MINDHDNNQHDDNADKQLVMIFSLFDRLVFAFQSHVDAFEWISSGRRTQICLRRCSGPRHRTHQNQESTMTSSFDSDPSVTRQEAPSAGNASGKIDWRKKIVFLSDFPFFVWICLDILELGTSWSAQCTLHPPFLHLWREPGQRRRWFWLHILHIYVYVMVNKNIYHHYFDSDFVTKNVSAHLTLVGPLHIFCNASKYSERTKQIA